MKEKELIQLVEDIFRNMRIEASVSASLDIDGVTWIVSVDTREGYYFTARDGEALVALNHVVKEIVRKSLPNQEVHVPVMVDINGFQKKHIENLRAIDHIMTERARFYKSKISLDPMSAYDRRIIHE